MRVVFLGTPEFALSSLRALLNSPHEVCAVFTQPDRPSGRGQKPQPPPVKVFAQQASIATYQPARIRAEENRPLLESLRPDFLVVAAYGQLLPRWLLKLPTVAPVNVHASLLPRYRGAAPIPWAILSGDQSTGVTTMWMEETLDTGPVLLRREVLIPPTMNCGELERLLSETGAELLIQTLEGLGDKTLQPVPQDHSQATLAPKINKEMARVSWNRPAMEIHNQVRAFNPWPLASSVFRGQKLQVFRSLPQGLYYSENRYEPGTLVELTRNGIRVQCGAGTVLELLEVQLAGRKKVSGREFANGARLRIGDLLFPSKG